MRLRLPGPATLQAIAITITGLSSIAWLPVVGAPYARFAVTLLAGSAWLVVWALGGLQRLDRARQPFFLGLAIAVAAVLISASASRFPALAYTYGGATGLSAPYWIALIVVLGAGTRVVLGRHTLGAITWQFAWILPVAVIGIAQSFLIGRIPFAYDNRDLFGPMMLLFAPVALGFAQAAPRARDRRLWWAAAAVLAAAAACARTTSSLVGLVAELLFLAIFAPGLLHLGVWWRRGVIGVCALLAAGFMSFGVMYVTDTMPAPVERFVGTTVFGSSALTRVEMWQVGLEEWRRRLWTGVGPDEYAFEGQGLFSERMHLLEHYPTPDNELPMDPHSLVVLLPVDFGLLGVIALAVMAGSWAAGVLWNPFVTDRGRLLRWSFALGALGFGWASLFTPFPLLFGGLPVLVAGLALTRPPVEDDLVVSPAVLATPRFISAVLTVVLALALGLGAILGFGSFVNSGGEQNGEGLQAATLFQPQVAYYRFAVLFQRGRFLGRQGDPEAYRSYQRAVDEAPPGVRLYAPYVVELVRLSLEDAGSRGRTDLSWERARLAEAAELSPSLPELAAEQLHLAIVAGDRAAVERALPRAQRWTAQVPEVEDYVARARELLSAPETPTPVPGP